jgi:hypothetical protein
MDGKRLLLLLGRPADGGLGEVDPNPALFSIEERTAYSRFAPFDPKSPEPLKSLKKL